MWVAGCFSSSTLFRGESRFLIALNDFQEWWPVLRRNLDMFHVCSPARLHYFFFFQHCGATHICFHKVFRLDGVCRRASHGVCRVSCSRRCSCFFDFILFKKRCHFQHGLLLTACMVSFLMQLLFYSFVGRGCVGRLGVAEVRCCSRTGAVASPMLRLPSCLQSIAKAVFRACSALWREAHVFP